MSENRNHMADGSGHAVKNIDMETSGEDLKIWADILNYGKQILKSAGIAEADLDAWYLFEQIFGISRAQYFMCARDPIAGRAVQEKDEDCSEHGDGQNDNADSLRQKLDAYRTALKKRASHIPLQQILGEQEFMGLSFFVNEHVLIPRQDTETLVELILKEQKSRDISILDMCTGSGCIAISLKKIGGYAHVEGADISEEALKVAKKNAGEILGTCRNSAASEASGTEVSDETVNFRHSDMFHAFQDSEQFDVIVSNPPYIPTDVIEGLEPEVRDHEPRGALDGTADGLYFYRILAEECAKHLTPGGHVYFEIGYDQGAAVKTLLDDHGFQDTKVIQDLAGKDRIVSGTWRV